jgi:hypothetical protein
MGARCSNGHSIASIVSIVRENLKRESRMMTDKAHQNKKGIYQHCSERHLHRYLAEFDFRYNNRIALGVNDFSRADRTLRVSSASG